MDKAQSCLVFGNKGWILNNNNDDDDDDDDDDDVHDQYDDEIIKQ